jgi:hypothetical protein
MANIPVDPRERIKVWRREQVALLDRPPPKRKKIRKAKPLVSTQIKQCHGSARKFWRRRALA